MLPLPSPTVDADSKEFWEYAKQGVLAAQRCERCGALQFPAYPCCRICNSMTLQWSPVGDRGTIYAWTTVYRSPRPEFAARVPYVLVAVDVEGVDGRYPGLLMGCPPGQARIGARVAVRFEEISGGYRLPMWHLDAEDQHG